MEEAGPLETVAIGSDVGFGAGRRERDMLGLLVPRSDIAFEAVTAAVRLDRRGVMLDIGEIKFFGYGKGWRWGDQ